jgi:ABC-type multidrug transport system ATPase subunit
MQGSPVISVRALRAGYGRRSALEDVSFEVHPGELVAVVGPNGAGKSTLLKVLAGLLEPWSGSVQVLGGPPRSPPQRGA